MKKVANIIIGICVITCFIYSIILKKNFEIIREDYEKVKVENSELQLKLLDQKILYEGRLTEPEDIILFDSLCNESGYEVIGGLDDGNN